jgi:hypothetical protein
MDTQNIKIVGDFPTLPKSGKTPDFDTRWRSSRRWNLAGDLDRILTWAHFGFFWLSGFLVLPHYAIWRCTVMTTYQSYPFLTKRKGVSNINGVRIVGDKSLSSPWLVLAVWLTQTWLVYLQKSTIDIWHTLPLIPQVVSVRLKLHGQCCICYENVFISWGKDHKTFLGLHTLGARSWPVWRPCP